MGLAKEGGGTVGWAEGFAAGMSEEVSISFTRLEVLSWIC